MHEKLLSMKSNLDMNPPQSFTRNFNPAKKDQIEEDKNNKIINENKI